MAAFVENPFFPLDEQMRVDHITALLALLLPQPTRGVVVNLLCKAYSPENATHIWAQWEPYFHLPLSHPLAEGTRAKDCILTLLQTAYTTPDMSSRDIHALADLVPSAIAAEIFILFTTITLREEEMMIYNPHRLNSRVG